MDTKEAFKQKIEAEVELAQAKLAELKAQAKSSAADARIKYAEHADELEKNVEAMKIKLKELSEASDDRWERLKAGVEGAWSSLSSSVRDTVGKFKKNN
jgi:mevalonate kinase